VHPTFSPWPMKDRDIIPLVIPRRPGRMPSVFGHEETSVQHGFAAATGISFMSLPHAGRGFGGGEAAFLPPHPDFPPRRGKGTGGRRLQKSDVHPDETR
jgi:hypothetical protein